MAWTYSNWTTLTGAAQKTAFNLHVQEVSDAISSNLSFAGRSIGNDPNFMYRKMLMEDGVRLGFLGMRTTGRATSNLIDFKSPTDSRCGATGVTCP